MARGESKKAMAFRFAPKTIQHLKRRAHEVGTAQTALVERYIAEGLRMDEHPLVYFREGEAGRRPAVLGSRLDVADVIETIGQNDNSLEKAADYLDLPVEQVEACLHYYADYKDEVDEWIERGRAAAEREQERLRRQQAALA